MRIFPFMRNCVLALGVLSLAAACRHRHANTPEGTAEAVKEVVEVQNKAMSNLKIEPALVLPPCEAESTKAQAALKTAAGSDEAVQANWDLMRCQMKVNNEARCKDKPQPCGVVAYNPPAKEGQEQPAPAQVDVAVPEQIAQACSVIGGAALGLAATQAGGDPTVGVMLGSEIGKYSCGAWFKAAARNDPTLFVAPMFVPTAQLLRDLKVMSGGTIDLTAETAINNTIDSIKRSTLGIDVNGVKIPVAILPVFPAGGTPGEVLDEVKGKAEDELRKVCKLAHLC